MKQLDKKTQSKDSIIFEKFIAPESIVICDKDSNWIKAPCDCTDRITCAYCVQAGLLKSAEQIKANDHVTNNIISSIRRNGIRKTARNLGLDHSTVKYWLKSRCQ